MDYLARLIAGANTSSKKFPPDTPAERLAVCTKICNSLRNLWQRGQTGPEDEVSTNRATELLTRLNALLEEESRKAAPHTCLLHIATSQIYIVIVKIALESQTQHVIKATAQTFHLLVNGEAEGLLDHRLFARALLDLVRYTVIGPRTIVDEATESSLIELLFEIATKIRLDPQILPAWFYPERDKSQARGAQGESRRNQFPLFYVLVQYVHNDGPVGDFARTGLLYLTETASRSKPLETWMLESDLAPQMASGLGALYSRLSRQFPPLEQNEKALPILALSDSSIPDNTRKETRANFQQNMKEFLSYLAFWQDTLTHCKSLEVLETLLDHFQVLFVQQLLYPSLLESSDVAGGSTAAVIAHLAKLLIALDHKVLAQRLLGYLLASKQVQPTKDRHRPRLSMSRRKSLEHLTALAEAAQSPSPDLFNLHDLISMSLRSHYPNTVNSCLKLLSVILDRHHPYALNGLFRTQPLDASVLDCSLKTFNHSLTKYFHLAASIGLDDYMDEDYEGALADAKMKLEQHSCIVQSLQNDQPLLPQMAIMTDCKLIESLNMLLQRFFANDTLTNLLLSEAIMSLAACENVSLNAWLLPKTEEGQDDFNSIYATVSLLSTQLHTWRAKFPEWDTLIQQRRLDLAEEELVVVPDTRPSRGQVRTPELGTPARSIGTSSAQNSRPTTPRGRPVPPPNFASIDGTLSASPSGRSDMIPRPLAGSPLRQGYFPTDLERGHSPTARSVSASTGPSPMHQELLATQEALLATPMSLQELDRRVGTSETSRSQQNQSSLAIAHESPSGTSTPQVTDDAATRSSVSLSHVLTNAIILQGFILEIAAITQVRGTMFGEVDTQV